MVKSIIKEIIIMLLLCVAILLILGVLFYDYIPSNKVVPGKIAYSTPENIQEEVNEEVIEANKTKITYEVTDADFNNLSLVLVYASLFEFSISKTT